MIREKQLVPGKMLENQQEVVFQDECGRVCRKPSWIPCMVVSYIPAVGRRHAKTDARRQGWDVLVFWFDDRRERLAKVTIFNDQYNLQKWRAAGW